jgi:hypothetical protein
MSTDRSKQRQVEFSNISTLETFNSYIKKYGFSISNFYDVHFVVTGNSGTPSDRRPFMNSVFNRIPSSETGARAFGSNSVKELMRYYADECTLPGYQIATGDYRINNSPMMKYAYGTVNSEINISFICDGRNEVKKTFDAWKEFIYASSIPSAQLRDSYNINQNRDLGRSRYRDDYACDIVIIKFERGNSSDLNKSTKFLPTKKIIPDYIEEELSTTRKNGFGYAIPTYSVRLVRAFPVNVSSVSLSSGASDLTKVQVAFEYDAIYSSALTGTGTVNDRITTNSDL